MFTVRPEQGILTPLLANLKNIYPLPGDVLDMGEKLPVEVHCAHPRGNPAVLGLFSLVTMFVVPLASGSFLIDLTNREVDKDVRTELRRSAGMDAKLMVCFKVASLHNTRSFVEIF